MNKEILKKLDTNKICHHLEQIILEMKKIVEHDLVIRLVQLGEVFKGEKWPH